MTDRDERLHLPNLTWLQLGLWLVSKVPGLRPACMALTLRTLTDSQREAVARQLLPHKPLMVRKSSTEATKASDGGQMPSPLIEVHSEQ
jgi:hypothetical protein